MGVQLNIKDPETVRLARELADSTGRTVTETIRAALAREVAGREADYAALMAQLTAELSAIRSSLPAELREMLSKEAMDAIYDDGLPI